MQRYLNFKIIGSTKVIMPVLWTISLFGFVGFYGVSTIVGYLMPNPSHTYIFNTYDFVWLGFMAYQPVLVI